MAVSFRAVLFNFSMNYTTMDSDGRYIFDGCGNCEEPESAAERDSQKQSDGTTIDDFQTDHE